MQQEPPLMEATVGLLQKGSGRNSLVLLGKRSSKFLKGIFTGPGGKCEPGESLEDCLCREFEEEVGVRLVRKSISSLATVDYYYQCMGNNGRHSNNGVSNDVANCRVHEARNGCHYRLDWRVHFFLIQRWEGKIRPLEGFEYLQWKDVEQLPYDQMCPDEKDWLQYILGEPQRFGHTFHVKVFRGFDAGGLRDLRWLEYDFVNEVPLLPHLDPVKQLKGG